MSAATNMLIGTGLDPDVQRFFNAAGITDPTQRLAIENMTLSLKTASLWALFYALYPFVGGTAGSHAENLISASYPITWTNGPTQDANGVTGNGTTQFGTCVGLSGNTVVPHLHGQTSYIRVNDNGASSRCFGGISDAVSLFYCGLRNGGTSNGFIMGDVANVALEAAAARTGTLTVNRTANNAAAMYDDGTSFLTSAVVDASTIPTIDFGVLCVKRPADAAFFSAANTALYAVHQPLTAPQTATLATIIGNYQTALGRNV